MQVKKSKRTMFVIIGLLAVLVTIGFLTIKPISKDDRSSKNIVLYGEQHSVPAILDKEFELWSAAYHNEGRRHLFIEAPYYTGEFLNLWMKSENNDILRILNQDPLIVAGWTQDTINFYKKIKRDCPETIFHATDIGFRYNTVGKRFLEYLTSVGMKDSETYKLTQENIEQGKYYYAHSDPAYRENKMTENFIREYDRLNGARVIGIYGSAHTDIQALDLETQSVDCMANQLYQKYGESLQTEDLTYLTLLREPLWTDTVKVGDKEYTAQYFGKLNFISSVTPQIRLKKFWRLENAYDDFRTNEKSGLIVPYDDYPMVIQEGQVFVIECVGTDGSSYLEFYRSDGNQWRGLACTDEFIVDQPIEIQRTDPLQ